MRSFALLLLLCASGCVSVAAGPLDSGAGPAMVGIPAGHYVPLYGDGQPVEVAAFRLDVRPVTNHEFLRFVDAEPRWRRDRVPALFADASYLHDWATPTALGEGEDAPRPDAPVTWVSWFAARAYCAWRGKRLPSLDEWEYVALADESHLNATDDPSFHQRILDWYGRPQAGRLPPVGSTFRNAYGVEDMHGLVWEWVEDFNSVPVTGESRADGSIDRNLFCAGAAAGTADPSDYAAFLRYAMRASLSAAYSVGNLGFRCAEDET